MIRRTGYHTLTYIREGVLEPQNYNDLGSRVIDN